MLNLRFQSWAARASAGERADAARDLARAFLHADLHPAERLTMERAMTALLDDGSPLVRRALAEALARAAHAPHHLISALASDQADIAAVVLGRSPILTDSELVDVASMGEPVAQAAIAARPGLSEAVVGALAELGPLEVARILCRNETAALTERSTGRILARFGRDGEVREALGARADTGAGLRHALVMSTADALCDFVTRCGWLTTGRARRVAQCAGERAAVSIGKDEAGRDLPRFVAQLRAAGHLTAALVVRAALSGEAALFEACLAELAGQPAGRVSGLVRRPDGLGFAALVRSAGLPDGLLPVLRAALAARRAGPPPRAALRREILAEVLARCGLDRGLPVAGLTALLRRFEAEAARDESRAAGAAGGERRPPVRIEPRFGPASFAAAA